MVIEWKQKIARRKDMFQIERQKQILDLVNSAHKANTAELSRKLQVSPVTIRRDIESLAKQGLVVKTHGGVVSITQSPLHEIPYSIKADQNLQAKRAIGMRAASIIEDGDIIILDSGSTTLEIAKNITQQHITVVTDDIKIAMELAGKANITTIMCGGTLIDSVYTLSGPTAISFFKTLHVNKTFLGCDAVDVDFGISDRSYEEVNVKREMIRAADQTIAVIDHTKFNKKVFCYLCTPSVIDILVTDQIDDRYLKYFKDHDARIMLAAN